MTARIAHHHAHILLRIESNSNIFVITFLMLRSDLLNPHLINFTFLPVSVIVEDLRCNLIFHTCMIAHFWGLCSFRVTLVHVAHGIIQMPHICGRYKPQTGFEPATFSLQVRCTTIVLLRQKRVNLLCKLQ